MVLDNQATLHVIKNEAMVSNYINSILSTHFYMNDSIYTNDEILIYFYMSQVEKIKRLFRRGHVHSSIIYLINNFTDKNVLLVDADRACNGLENVVKM